MVKGSPQRIGDFELASKNQTLKVLFYFFDPS